MMPVANSLIFLSHSQTDWEAAGILRTELEKADLSVFREKNAVRLGDGWLTTLQTKLQHCTNFVLLIGHDGVQEWQLVEMQLALSRHLLPSDDPRWLPIYPVLLPTADLKQIPPLLSAFAITRWQIDSAVPKSLLTAIRSQTELHLSEKVMNTCPFLGFNSFQRDQAPLFFGRRKETLDIIRYFGVQSLVHPEHICREGEAFCRWVQIEGNSVSGKTSLINAGLIPLIEQGALWPRTGFKEWKILGPMVPGDNPLQQLAELLENTLIANSEERNPQRSYKQLLPDDTALNKRLNAVKNPNVGFILIVDQFEELFNLSNTAEQRRFDAQLANALLENDSRFFLITAVSTGFLEGFERLLYLPECYNTRCKRYSLPNITPVGLREIIEYPAKLAGLDVRELIPAILDDAKNEAGILPLVGNALRYLWEQRLENYLNTPLYKQKGGLAGLMETQADDLLTRLEQQIPDSTTDALNLLLALTHISPDGRHTRQRVSLEEALRIVSHDDLERGQKIIAFLSGKAITAQDKHNTSGNLHLITLVGGTASSNSYPSSSTPNHQFVDLLYEPLIRTRGFDEKTGQPIAYWQTLYDYISNSGYVSSALNRLTQRAKTWEHSRGVWRWWHLAGWSDLLAYHKLGYRGDDTTESRYIRWSKIAFGVQSALLTLGLAFVGESFYWTHKHHLPLSYMLMQQRFRLIDAGLLAVPLPEMVMIEADEIVPVVEPNISFLADGEPVVQEAKFATPGSEIGLTKRFSLSKYEITYQQYDYYVWQQDGKVPYPADVKNQRHQHPVVNVSWYDANAYLTWLSEKTHKHYRLPTEAEWQYADRAKTTTDFWWGDGIGKNKANCIDCGSRWDGQQSAPVGSFAPNAFGLYDTVGNVYEWTCSAWKEQPDGNEYTCSNQHADSLVFLGGSWRNRSIFLLYSSRDWDVPGFTSDNLGFRAARMD